MAGETRSRGLGGRCWSRRLRLARTSHFGKPGGEPRRDHLLSVLVRWRSPPPGERAGLLEFGECRGILHGVRDWSHPGDGARKKIKMKKAMQCNVTAGHRCIGRGRGVRCLVPSAARRNASPGANAVLCEEGPELHAPLVPMTKALVQYVLGLSQESLLVSPALPGHCVLLAPPVSELGVVERATLLDDGHLGMVWREADKSAATESK